MHQSTIRRSFIMDCLTLAGRNWGVKLEVYEHLLRINAGFDQAIRSLAALGKDSAFHRGTLARFAALSKEARAAACAIPRETMILEGDQCE
jgi:hypothetical protein